MHTHSTHPCAFGPGPRYPEICRAYDAAYSSIAARRPWDLTEDAFHEGALKWWRVLNRRVPEYLLDGPDRIHDRYLRHWILVSAYEYQKKVWARDERKRSKGFHVVSEDAVGELDAQDPTEPTLDERIESRLDAGLAAARLASIGRVDPVVELRAEGLSYDDIGAELGIEPGTARVHMHRATARLSSLLGPEA